MHLVEKIRLFPTEEQEVQLQELAVFCRDAANYISEFIYTNRLRSKGVGTLYKPDWETRTDSSDPEKTSLYIVLTNQFDFSGRTNLATAIIQRVKSTYKAVYARNIKQGDAFYRAGGKKYKQLKKDGLKGEPLKEAAKLTDEEKTEIAERYGLEKAIVYKRLSIPTLKQNTKWKDSTVSFWKLKDVSFGTRMKDITGKDAILKLHKSGKWVLHLPVEQEKANTYDPKGWLGVDVGLWNLVVTSDDKVYHGEENRRRSETYENQRQRLQKKGTLSAKRRLRSLSEAESRWRKDHCHKITSDIIKTAKAKKYGIAVEKLTNIRRSMRNSKKLNRQLHGSFPFHQILSMLKYKAGKAGVPYQEVNPAYTTLICEKCGNVDKNNVPKRSHFTCTECGFTDYADLVAARNIADDALRAGA